MEEVSLKVARYLKEKFGYNYSSLYIYDNDGRKKFWIEKIENPTPAPTIIEAVEFLWRNGLKIYNIPEGEMSRGIIQIGKQKIILRKLGRSPSESYNICLEYLSKGK